MVRELNIADPRFIIPYRVNLSQSCSLRAGKSQADPALNFGVAFMCLEVEQLNQSLDSRMQVQIQTQILRDIQIDESHLFQ